MASVDAPRAHSLCLGPDTSRGTGHDFLDAFPRNCGTTPCSGALSPADPARPASLRQWCAPVFARVVILLVLPHCERGSGDPFRQGQLGEIGLDACVGHPLEILMQRMLRHVLDNRGCCALEDRLELRLPIAV